MTPAADATPAAVLALREATREAHARIERVPALARLLAEDCSGEEYRAALLRLHSFVAPLEAAMLARIGGEIGLVLSAGRRAPLLRRDLSELGTAPAPRAPAAALPATSSPAEALGCAYVLEGSLLGGRVIARSLRARLGPALGGATRYLEAGGDDVPQRWRRFGRLLDTALADPEARARAAGAASACFERLAAWLDAAPARPRLTSARGAGPRRADGAARGGRDAPGIRAGS